MTTKRYVRIAGQGSARYGRRASGRVELLDAAPWLGGRETGESVPEAVARPICPVMPSKIIGIGRNYAAHAREMGNELPSEPLMFLKAPSTLLAPGGTVRLPPESRHVEYEAELGVVIGRRAKRIPVERALEVVFGYTILCDVTARDLQRSDGQWSRAKSFDTFCPLGPDIVTRIDPSSLGIRLFVGERLAQNGNTSDMVFDVARLIAHVSAAMTLEPGDVIATGTPEGVGPIAAGDHVRIEIDGLGELSFDVASE